MKFVHNKDVAPTQLDAYTSRKILAYSDTLMPVVITCKAGAVGAPHTHAHEQVCYVISGSFSFTNDGETRVVNAGDSLRFAPGVLHGMHCLADGKLLDVFTPCRKDFL